MSLYCRTDFTCCPKDQTYSYDRQHDVGQLGFSDKVGTCDWEVSVYRWPLELGNIEGNLPELSPVLTDDGGLGVTGGNPCHSLGWRFWRLCPDPSADS
jgi:hypothetical protein